MKYSVHLSLLALQGNTWRLVDRKMIVLAEKEDILNSPSMEIRLDGYRLALGATVTDMLKDTISDVKGPTFYQIEDNKIVDLPDHQPFPDPSQGKGAWLSSRFSLADDYMLMTLLTRPEETLAMDYLYLYQKKQGAWQQKALLGTCRREKANERFPERKELCPALIEMNNKHVVLIDQKNNAIIY
jgi:hypothetical protein